MTLDIILLVIFLGSTGTLWYKVFQRLPEVTLTTAHNNNIETYPLYERARKSLFVTLWLRMFSRNKHYHEIFNEVLTKILKKIHILLMKVDNATVALSEKIRGEKINNRETGYFKNLSQDKNDISTIESNQRNGINTTHSEDSHESRQKRSSS